MRPEAESVIPVFIELLKDRDQNMRGSVAVSLGVFGPKARVAAPTLLLALKDENAGVRQGAAWSLGRIGPEQDMVARIVPQLRGLFEDRDALVRVQAAWSLWKLNGDTKDTVPILAEALSRKNETMMIFTAVYALADMGPKAKEAMPELRKLLEDIDPRAPFHTQILETMKKIDPKAVPAKK
jgi:HEAT repeat protein